MYYILHGYFVLHLYIIINDDIFHYHYNNKFLELIYKLL